MGLLAVLLFAVWAVPAVVAESSVVDQITSGDFEQARENLRTVSSPREKLFLKGYLSFEQKEYHQARRYFTRIVEKYPESARGRDSLYYLDRLKLFSTTDPDSPPLVKVLLDRGVEFSGKVTGDFELRDPAGENRLKIDSGEEWRVSRDGEQIVFESRNQAWSSQFHLSPATQNNGQNAITLNQKKYRGNFEFRIADGEILLINRLPLDNYLYGVIEKEAAPNWPLATIKAQAVASRSFALYSLRQHREEPYDLGDDHFSQLYGGKSAETRQARRGVDQTRGEVLTYKGKVVPGYFHSNSGGHVESGEKIWAGDDLGFIKSHPDTWSENTKFSEWQTTVKLADLNRALEELGRPEMAEAPQLQVKEKLSSGRALNLEYVAVNDEYITVPADEIRTAVGTEKIRSSWFVRIDFARGEINFKGKGWGHGVGMSQWGACGMGRAGLDYRKILNFYYNRATISGDYGPAGSTVRF